jgi:hypothetical protein
MGTLFWAGVRSCRCAVVSPRFQASILLSGRWRNTTEAVSRLRQKIAANPERSERLS